MTASDLANIISGVAPVVREYVDGAVKAFGDRLQSIEQRIASVKDGRDGDPGVSGERGSDGAPGRNGSDAEPVDEEAIVQRVAALIPRAVDGVNGRDGSSFASGVGAPSFDAKSGDVYLDAKTGDIYQWR